MRSFRKIIVLSMVLLSFNMYADLNVNSHWNAPGVTVREPDVWSTPNVMVTDTFGRPMPTSTPSCYVSRICYSNGNCVLKKICN